MARKRNRYDLDLASKYGLSGYTQDDMRKAEMGASNYGIPLEEYLQNVQKFRAGQDSIFGMANAELGGDSGGFSGGAGMAPVPNTPVSNQPTPSATPSYDVPQTPPAGFSPPQTGGGLTPSGNFSPNQSTQDLFKQLFNQSTQGTLNEYNNAANRLRERLDSAAEGQRIKATDFNIGRGFGNSGSQERSMYEIGASNQDAYSQGLATLSSQFEEQRQRGLQNALGAATGLSGDQQFWGKLGQDVRMSDLDRESRERINRANISSNEKLGRMDTNQQAWQQFMDMLLRGRGI